MTSGRGVLRRLSRRLPSPLVAVLAALCLGLGIVVITRPATSLGLLLVLIGLGLILAGLLRLIGATGDPGSGLAAWAALATMLCGVAVLVWPGLTTAVLAVLVGVTLVLWGLASIGDALQRGAADRRIAAGLLGAASVLFGFVALAWPDVTLLLVGVVFGGWLILQGLTVGWALLRPLDRKRDRAPSTPAGRWLAVIGAAVSLVLSGGAAAASWAARGGVPEIDSFYVAPREVPAEPGRLVRSEPFTRGVPDNARGWRILYTTTRDDRTPAVASALVVVPATGAGQWPVVNVAHGTTGVASPCAPSLAVEPFEAGAFFVLDQVIDQGWAVVQPDYLGLGTEGPHPYLVGDASARAVLDASRAARELAPARLGAQNVVWGHSQGGGAALWTGGIAAGYAPDLSIVGVAALAPASDLPGLVESLPTVTGGSVFASYVLSAYSAVYPDVDFAGYVRPAARVVVREMAGRCLAEPGVVVSVLNALALSRDPLVFAADPGDGTLGARLAQNVPTLPVAAPLLVAQGEADSLITPDAQDGYIAGRCAAGQRLDYRRYPGRDHVGLVEPDSPLIPDLLEWTRDRFAGESVADGCNVPQR